MAQPFALLTFFLRLISLYEGHTHGAFRMGEGCEIIEYHADFRIFNGD